MYCTKIFKFADPEVQRPAFCHNLAVALGTQHFILTHGLSVERELQLNVINWDQLTNRTNRSGGGIDQREYVLPGRNQRLRQSDIYTRRRRRFYGDGISRQVQDAVEQKIPGIRVTDLITEHAWLIGEIHGLALSKIIFNNGRILS